MKTSDYDVIIIGSGAAGISAAIWLKQLGVSAIMLEKLEQIGGQLHKTFNRVIDYPGFYGLKGGEILDRFTQHLSQMDCQWKTGVEVTEIVVKESCIHVLALTGIEKEPQIFTAKYVILATGATERRLEVPGEAELLAKVGILSTSKDLPLFENKNVVIIGGGDRAFEGAFRTKDIAKQVTLVHHHDGFRAKEEYVNPVLSAQNVNVRTFSKLDEVIWRNDRVIGVMIRDCHTDMVEKIDADYVLIRIGVEANYQLVQELVQIQDNRIVTNSFYQTSCDHIYAIGDVINTSDFSSISLSVGQGMKVAKKIWLDLRS